MRRMILTSLALLPVIAHAQAATPTGPKPSTSSAIVQADLTQPFELAELAIPAGTPAAPTAAISNANHAAIRESIQTRMAGDLLLIGAMRQPGAAEYAMSGSVPYESSAPKVTRAVELELSAQELAEQPAVSNVVLRAIVDENGVPRNVAVTHSAGSVIDRRAIEAVNQYRFKPATVDNKPTWASVSITIKLQKQ